MADNKQQSFSPGDRRQPSRLQRRAPASIQVNRATDWNVAIPLLSPLITSPTSPESDNLKAAINSFSSSAHKEDLRKEHLEKPMMVFKKWQHPAAPFCYEPAPLVPFVCTGSTDRR
ncbi:PREDICTED: uncharacterized protein At4g14450, chloroplastic-like [Nicotiana attenuata]|uniref:Uncharacterized protein, chloroplastic n=1 Tax=Nicotiana attenuata TaxID=49451 RepID=A0A1J6IGB8_NICAT|nr:PREDICTED: uncharacterized protein At4g14450, chloroplastic-like [Nicotiana attenuata]OIS97970.1 uncharacterized protein, chloroplastic [Nicotiana attenuata]